MKFKKKLGKAFNHIKKGNYKSGISILESLRDDHSNKVSVRNLLGIAYFKIEDYESAYREFSHAVRLDVDNPELQSNLDATMCALVDGTRKFETTEVANWFEI